MKSHLKRLGALGRASRPLGVTLSVAEGSGGSVGAVGVLTLGRVDGVMGA